MTEIPHPSPPSGSWADPRAGRPPVHPSVSEAGRLLCAGTYLDAGYRERVIDELYVHEERLAAPAYGFDTTRVLAHALRARRMELTWAAGILAAWFVGTVITSGALTLLLAPFLLLSLARWLRARDLGLLRFLGVVVRVYAWWMIAVVVIALIGLGLALGGAFGDLVGVGALFLTDSLTGSSSSSSGPFGGPGGSSSGSGGLALWMVPLTFVGLVVLVALQRSQVARVITGELSRHRYADHAGDPAEATPGPRFERIRRRIRAEQHSPLVMYDVNDPLCGAGEPYYPWHLSVELRPREDLGPDRKPTPLTNTHLVERIVPLLQALRVPSPHGSPQAEAAVQDRLRELVIDECVFVPVDGLPHRDQAPLSPQFFAEQRAVAIEEGGERRRHFLRVRVGGWDEDLVVTVFVRVHTQGGMLMLEVAPHLLNPVHVLFYNADAEAHRYLNNNALGRAVWALVRTPASFGASVATLARGLAGWWRIVTGGHGGARPEGPRTSVRELAAQDNGSIFHLMDADRYLKTIQDRVVGGVTLALHEAGWHTEEFARRSAITIAGGGTYIHSVHDSAFSVGGSGAQNTMHGKSGTGGAGGNRGSEGRGR
ncbi:hypothetical protein [Streptomyces sp. WAC06614]|uniref:hypothetical protein n=1 Tax=Streptomyces sp. WAC06614 TaxID=2487416 RepID=UPI000F76F6A9|nr:hypothetical protein [Streptomyces sp. WAC06614]RSS75513.1 hypothetical protein EF918_24125 [Streptomyces sp. WAC06614]